MYTCERTADQCCSDADVSVPGERVKAYVTGCERTVQVVNPLQATIHVPHKLLYTSHTNQSPSITDSFSPDCP